MTDQSKRFKNLLVQKRATNRILRERRSPEARAKTSDPTSRRDDTDDDSEDATTADA